MKKLMMNTWRYIEEDAVSAASGLAGDEFLMRGYSADAPNPAPTLRLYTYRSHCALVGRFQNITAELDLDACRREAVQIGRRPTGGGAIIMGKGQLGLCLTCSGIFEPGLERAVNVYHRFAEPLILALKELGIEAKFRGRNDLEVNGRKIAGLGVYYDARGAILFHTSLLVDLDISLMLRLLRIPVQKISDKVLVKSVKQRITTVSRELSRAMTVAEVRRRVRESFEEHFSMKLVPQPLSEAEKKEVEILAREKYLTDEWLYQYSPQADMTGMSLLKTPAGLLRTYVALKGEIIKSVLITGDFFEQMNLFNEIEGKLKWSPFEKESIARVVATVFDRNSGIPAQIHAADVVKAVWRAGRRASRENRFNYRGTCYYPQKKTEEISDAV